MQNLLNYIKTIKNNQINIFLFNYICGITLEIYIQKLKLYTYRYILVHAYLIMFVAFYFLRTW